MLLSGNFHVSESILEDVTETVFRLGKVFAFAGNPIVRKC